MPLPTAADPEPFYADSRWGRFAGQLRVADRIDLLLRDASGA